MTVQTETAPIQTEGAEILTPPGLQLPATHRCRCGSQAWVEVEIGFTRTTQILNTEVTKATYEPGAALMVTEKVAEAAKETLLFCAHHYGKVEAALKETAVRIVDYRGTLQEQERGERGGSV